MNPPSDGASPASRVSRSSIRSHRSRIEPRGPPEFIPTKSSDLLDSSHAVMPSTKPSPRRLSKRKLSILIAFLVVICGLAVARYSPLSLTRADGGSRAGQQRIPSKSSNNINNNNNKNNHIFTHSGGISNSSSLAWLRRAVSSTSTGSLQVVNATWNKLQQMASMAMIPVTRGYPFVASILPTLLQTPKWCFIKAQAGLMWFGEATKRFFYHLRHMFARLGNAATSGFHVYRFNMTDASSSAILNLFYKYFFPENHTHDTLPAPKEKRVESARKGIPTPKRMPQTLETKRKEELPQTSADAVAKQEELKISRNTQEDLMEAKEKEEGARWSSWVWKWFGKQSNQSEGTVTAPQDTGKDDDTRKSAGGNFSHVHSIGMESDNASGENVLTNRTTGSTSWFSLLHSFVPNVITGRKTYDMNKSGVEKNYKVTHTDSHNTRVEQKTSRKRNPRQDGVKDTKLTVNPKVKITPSPPVVPIVSHHTVQLSEKQCGELPLRPPVKEGEVYDAFAKDVAQVLGLPSTKLVHDVQVHHERNTGVVIEFALTHSDWTSTNIDETLKSCIFTQFVAYCVSKAEKKEGPSTVEPLCIEKGAPNCEVVMRQHMKEVDKKHREIREQLQIDCQHRIAEATKAEKALMLDQLKSSVTRSVLEERQKQEKVCQSSTADAIKAERERVQESCKLPAVKALKAERQRLEKECKEHTLTLLMAEKEQMYKECAQETTAMLEMEKAVLIKRHNLSLAQALEGNTDVLRKECKKFTSEALEKERSGMMSECQLSIAEAIENETRKLQEQGNRTTREAVQQAYEQSQEECRVSIESSITNEREEQHKACQISTITVVKEAEERVQIACQDTIAEAVLSAKTDLQGQCQRTVTEAVEKESQRVQKACQESTSRSIEEERQVQREKCQVLVREAIVEETKRLRSEAAVLTGQALEEEQQRLEEQCKASTTAALQEAKEEMKKQCEEATSQALDAKGNALHTVCQQSIYDVTETERRNAATQCEEATKKAVENALQIAEEKQTTAHARVLIEERARLDEACQTSTAASIAAESKRLETQHQLSLIDAVEQQCRSGETSVTEALHKQLHTQEAVCEEKLRQALEKETQRCDTKLLEKHHESEQQVEKHKARSRLQTFTAHLTRVALYMTSGATLCLLAYTYSLRRKLQILSASLPSASPSTDISSMKAPRATLPAAVQWPPPTLVPFSVPNGNKPQTRDDGSTSLITTLTTSFRRVYCAYLASREVHYVDLLDSVVSREAAVSLRCLTESRHTHRLREVQAAANRLLSAQQQSMAEAAVCWSEERERSLLFANEANARVALQRHLGTALAAELARFAMHSQTPPLALRTPHGKRDPIVETDVNESGAGSELENEVSFGTAERLRDMLLSENRARHAAELRLELIQRHQRSEEGSRAALVRSPRSRLVSPFGVEETPIHGIMERQLSRNISPSREDVTMRRISHGTHKYHGDKWDELSQSD